MGNERYLSTSEAAQLLKMTARRIVGLCSEGRFDGVIRNGRSWRIPLSSVQAYMNSVSVINKKENSILPLAVGNTAFPEIAANCYYVDKTLIIKDLIDSRNSVTLFTRPRRFGKTLMLNMLKTYFEISKTDTAVFFHNMQIWQCDDKYKAYQGAYPVVYLTFKDVKYNNWADSFEAIKLVLRDEFNRHDELMRSTNLDEQEKLYIKDMQEGRLSNVEYCRALTNLTRMLSKHHGKQTVILIDEYDTPIQQGYTHGFYNDVISFMRNFMSGGLKDNEWLAFGVLTGILRVSKENLFSGLNNLIVDTVLDDKYSEYFGFTFVEVREMAEYYGYAEKLPEIKKWYDGYRFGSTEIYNPWSVTCYFHNECKPKTFWANTSDNQIIQDIMKNLQPGVADELYKLMNGETVHTALDMEVIYPNIAEGADAIFSFLLIAGYLKPVGEAEETAFGTFVELQLPNIEIQRVYNSEVLVWLSRRLSGGIIPELEKAVYLNNPVMLKEAIRRFMLNCISSFDGAAEGFYHGMVLGLLAGMSSKYIIKSNREAGEGRFDLMLEPKEASLPAMIMEFKASRSADEEQLKSLAESAVNQITEKQYGWDLNERGIAHIVKYGIAFSGKSVEVVSEEDEMQM